LAFFYEIHSSNNAVLKRDGGFAPQPAAVNADVLDEFRSLRSLNEHIIPQAPD